MMRIGFIVLLAAMGSATSSAQLRIPAEADQHSWLKPITIPV
jgi:hypothetical protein